MRSFEQINKPAIADDVLAIAAVVVVLCCRSSKRRSNPSVSKLPGVILDLSRRVCAAAEYVSGAMATTSCMPLHVLRIHAVRMPCCLVHKTLLFVIAFDTTQKSSMSSSWHAISSMMQVREK